MYYFVLLQHPCFLLNRMDCSWYQGMLYPASVLQASFHVHMLNVHRGMLRNAGADRILSTEALSYLWMALHITS